MKLVPRKRVEVRIDKPLMRRVREVAIGAGIDDLDFLTTMGGVRKNEFWSDDQVTGGAGSVIILVAITDDKRAEQFVQALKPLWDAYSLKITVTDTNIAEPA